MLEAYRLIARVCTILEPVTAYCCWECRKTLTYQAQGEPWDWRDEHWYGCSHCGRDVCTACAIQQGRRCGRCGGTLERDRKFPLRLLADGDWREFLPRVDPDHGVVSRNEELVVYATPERIDAILDAIPSAAAGKFWTEILDWEVRRRLGTLDHLSYLPGPTTRLDDDWRVKLAGIAAAGLAGRAGFDEAALALCERIAGWSRLRLPAAGILDDLERAFASGRELLVDEALSCVAGLSLTPAELLRLTVDRLASTEPSVRGLGLRVLLSGLGETMYTPRGPLQPNAFALTVEALPGLIADGGAERVVERLMHTEIDVELRPATLCRALGLGDALVERMSGLLIPGQRRFARVLREIIELLPTNHAALAEAERALTEGTLSRINTRQCLYALADLGDPRFVGLFVAELDGEHVDAAVCGLLQARADLPEHVRARVRARLDLDRHGFGWTHPRVRRLPDELRRRWCSDEALLERLLERALTLRGLAERLDPMLAASPRYAAELERRRPRLLLEAQRALAGEDHAWDRASLVTALGRLRTEPGDGPEALLLDRLEDADEPADVRLAAARALSERPLAADQYDRLSALTADPRPLVRAWALRLIDDPGRWAAAVSDSSEFVRHLAR